MNVTSNWIKLNFEWNASVDAMTQSLKPAHAYTRPSDYRWFIDSLETPLIN